MISIIICSRTKDISLELRDNLSHTIGCDYELIVIDNSKSTYSIFEAYNIGIKSSKYEFCCFLHDDILMHTANWGQIILNIFEKDSKIGLMGLAGAKVKSKFPSAWWRCSLEHRHVKLLQHSKSLGKEMFQIGFDINDLEEVVVVDGVFMAARKVKGIQFNESLEGYHNYDLNISFEYLKKQFKVYVTSRILIEHFSSGNLNDDWLKSTFKLHKIYKHFLPLHINNDYDEDLEKINAKRFIRACLERRQRRMAFLTWTDLLLKYPLLRYHIKFWFNFFESYGRR